MDCLEREFCEECLIEATQGSYGSRCPHCNSYRCYTLPQIIEHLVDRIEELEHKTNELERNGK